MANTFARLHKSLLACVAIIGLAGCGGYNPPAIDIPVTVKGRLISNDINSKLDNVSLNLQPLENGYMKTIDVGSDGTFTVETQPGKYAYFLTPKAAKKPASKIVSQLSEPSMERTLVVASGNEIEIKID